MKPEVRGTSCDPRALKAEQWLVKVRMIHDGRTFNLQAAQPLFEKLEEGDRVQISYRLGKYTKTVWGEEIKGWAVERRLRPRIVLIHRDE